MFCFALLYLPNPFEPGVISVKRLENNFGTNLANFYTRNVFKPLVLMRFAFFTRVFLEEQARVATAGLDAFYNNPFTAIRACSSKNTRVKKANLIRTNGLNTFLV